MNKIIPPETYKFIEAKLHGYSEITRQIEEWRLSVKYPGHKQTVPGAGYISDPTANQAVKLADPPEYIKNCEKWLELIELTQSYCRQNRNRIFDIWYGQGRQTVIRACAKNNISEKAFKRNRNSAVYFLFIRAMDAGL